MRFNVRVLRYILQFLHPWRKREEAGAEADPTVEDPGREGEGDHVPEVDGDPDLEVDGHLHAIGIATVQNRKSLGLGLGTCFLTDRTAIVAKV